MVVAELVDGHEIMILQTLMLEAHVVAMTTYISADAVVDMYFEVVALASLRTAKMATAFLLGRV